jgi:hypothetical protein
MVVILGIVCVCIGYYLRSWRLNVDLILRVYRYASTYIFTHVFNAIFFLREGVGCFSGVGAGAGTGMRCSAAR